MATMLKRDLERRLAELEAQNKRLLSSLKTGRFRSFDSKYYCGVPFEPEVERIAIERCRDLLPDQLDDYREGTRDCLLHEKWSGDCPIAGVDTYVVRYSYNQAEGCHVEKVWKAIEVL